jgi:flagellin-like hook-associated protein FlgL
VTNYGSNTLSIFVGNGNGTFGPQSTITCGSRPTVAELADLNGDSKLDLLVTDDNDNLLSILLGNGNGTFGARTTKAAQTQPQYIAIGDFNGDGAPDVATANNGSGKDSIFIANTSTSTTTTTTASQVLSIATQDYATDMLATLDSVIARLNSYRATMGAFASRLDFATSVNANTIENISTARSEIMDVDLVAETSEFARLQILQKAGIAVLGQANLSANLALTLLAKL